LRVETDTLIRPLANMNYKTAEDKARVNNNFVTSDIWHMDFFNLK